MIQDLQTLEYDVLSAEKRRHRMLSTREIKNNM
jgi:hypothetical protein